MVKHFAKKKKEAKTEAKEENIKSKEKVTQVENEILIRYIDIIAFEPRHKYMIFHQPIN